MRKNSVLSRNNINVLGTEGKAMIFAHGFGCDQNMWRFMAPEFKKDFRVVLFDHVGSGNSDLKAYDRVKYGRLDGYASDVLDICHALDLQEIIFVGHSVSATIGILAAIREPERFLRLILIGASPCFIDDSEYVGGFSRDEIDNLIELVDSNPAAWAAQMAPVIMGNPARPELSEELKHSFCRIAPEVFRQFARVTFTADHRADLPKVSTRSLLLQCADDPIAPFVVGDYMRRHLASSEMIMLHATGHCPHMSAPEETGTAIRMFLADIGQTPDT